MFIDRGHNEIPAPFEGAEFNLAGARLVSFRPFERRWGPNVCG